MSFKALLVVLAAVAVSDAFRGRGGSGGGFRGGFGGSRFAGSGFGPSTYSRSATQAQLPTGTPWNQAVPNSDLTDTGSIVIQDNYAYIFSNGVPAANILPSDSFMLFEETGTQFITRISGYPFCIITFRQFSQAALAGLLGANPTGWNTTVMAVVPYEGRGVRLSTSEYRDLIAKSSRIDALCEGKVVSTENVTQFAHPGAPSTVVNYYLPMESFNVTVYEQADRSRFDGFGGSRGFGKFGGFGGFDRGFGGYGRFDGGFGGFRGDRFGGRFGGGFGGFF